MKRTQHGENLIQLTRLFGFNCYLVKEDDGYTLIDTNLPDSSTAIMQAAQDTPIQRIVLTHSHNDHVASLDKLHAALPDAEVLISTREARFMRGDMSLDEDEPQDKLRGGYVTCETTPTRTLEHGDRVGSLEVVASPGHTPGHISLLDTRDGTLIAGDAFQTQGGIAVTGKLKLLFPFPAMATWHFPSAVASAKSLRNLNPSRLAVGHGRVLENPVAAMGSAIAEAEQSIAPVSVG